MAGDVIEIEEGGIAEEAAIARQLVKMGYEKNYQVEAPGQFSVRGGIVDIFDLTRENPVRIELWGDEVESIRSFDIESQRSIEKLTEVSIYPATELILSKKALEMVWQGWRRTVRNQLPFSEKRQNRRKRIDWNRRWQN